MTSIKIVSWNVNSLRVRLPHVLALLDKHQPDILALQETKIPDADFPYEVLHQVGYHAIASGQKAYNGVAILSREKAPLIVTDIIGLDDPQRRILATTIAGIRIINIYVPNGESVTSAKYQYKLNWLAKLQSFLKQELAEHPRLIVLGDFNIAPEAMDVHDPKLWAGSVLFSELERQAFRGLLALGLCDCFRVLSPQDQSYSWWDYRMNAFKRNMGLRIDHILASTQLMHACTACYIDKLPRALERPSDHAPIIAEFRLDT